MRKRNVFKDIKSAFDSEWLWDCQEYPADNQRLFRYTSYYDKLRNDVQKKIGGESESQDDLENDLFILLYSERNDMNSGASCYIKKWQKQ